MKRKLLALTVGLMVVGGASFAYGATVGAKVAAVKVVNVTGDYHADGTFTTIPGTAFNARKGPAQIHYTFMASGGTYPSLVWADSGNFTYANFRVSCTDGTDYSASEIGTGSGVLTGGYCELTASASFSKAVTVSLGVGGTGSISNIDGSLTQVAA